MTAFALRSIDNALVWVKDEPLKPVPMYYDPHDHDDNIAWARAVHTYQSTLKQAIADGVRVADEKAIELLIVKAYPELIGTVAKPDTIYRLDCEMEERFVAPSPHNNVKWEDDIKLAYLKPKTENDMKDNAPKQRDHSKLREKLDKFKQKEKLCYFIEQTNLDGYANGLWLNRLDGGFTRDPDKAKQFDTMGEAEGFRKQYPLPDCVVTEHIFMSPTQSEILKNHVDALAKEIKSREQDREEVNDKETRKRIESELKSVLPMCWDDKLGFDDVGSKVIEWAMQERWNLSQALRLCQEANRRAYTTLDEWEKAADKHLPPTRNGKPGGVVG